MATDRRSLYAQHVDRVVRVSLAKVLTDPGESDASQLDTELALYALVSDFRKDRLSRKGGHGKPVNLPPTEPPTTPPPIGSGIPESLTFSPVSFSVAPGQTAQMTATVRDNAGTVLTTTVTWSSTNSGIATVDANGLVTGVSPGPVTIRATVPGLAAESIGTVTAPPVASVTVAPSSFSLRATDTRQLDATVRDAGSSILTGRVVTWQSDATSIATVSATGVVTGVAAGSATITATSEGISGTSVATITVAQVPVVTTVTLSPASFTIPTAGTQQLTAVARDQFGAVVSTTFTWASSAALVASVDASGLATGVGAGSATISATANGVTGTSAATVSAVPVATVTVTPSSFVNTVGQTRQLTATVRDGSANVLTGRVVTWQSSAPSIATVSSSGLVTAVAAGSATITATSEGISGTSAGTISVAPPATVASVTVSPSSFTKVAGTTQTLTATVRDGSNNVLTGRVVTWASSNATVATVSTPGQTATVLALAGGTATITATCETVQGTSAATVTAVVVPVITTVTVAPSSFSITLAATQQLTATAKDQNGNTVPATFAWASSNPPVATVSATGLVTPVTTGIASITATTLGVVGTSAATITAVPVASVSVSPGTFSKTVGQTQQLTATLRDAGSNILTGRTVTWTSSAPSLASVSSSGLVTVLAAGSVTITATSEGRSGTSVGTLSAAPPAAVSTVTISPSSFTKSVGSTQSLTATVRDAGNNVLTGRTITWQSSSTPTDTVTTPGQSSTVTALAPGSATITATCETVPGTSAATITAVPVASVTVSPSTFIVSVGGTTTLTAVTKDASGNTLTGRTITWSSSNVATATVSTPGASATVTGVGVGSVTITATSEGISGTSPGSVPSAGSSGSSPLNAPSTTVYNPRPHPMTLGAQIDLPQTFIDSRYAQGGTALTFTTVTLSDTGNSVTNATNLQAAIDTASTRAGHTKIRLPNTFTAQGAPACRLKAHTQGAFWTYIEAVTLPCSEGVRCGPSDMANWPTLIADASYACVQCDASADRYRFTGVRFQAVTTGGNVYALVHLYATLPNGTEVQSTAASCPQLITFDRCHLKGNNARPDTAVGNVRDAFNFNARSGAVVDSYIEAIWWNGVESHGILSYNTPGPCKIVNNYIEAGSIGMLFGGAVPQISGCRPADFEVRRNNITRRASWFDTDGSWDGIPSSSGRFFKNGIECKNSLRMLFEGNVITKNTAGAQTGSVILIKSAGDGSDLSAGQGMGTTHVTLRYNYIDASNRGWVVAGSPDETGVIPCTRVALYHNLFTNIGTAMGYAPSGCGLAWIFITKTDDLKVRFNTLVHNVTDTAVTMVVDNVDVANKTTGFDFSDNVSTSNSTSNGVAYSGQNSGQPSLNRWASTWTWARNVVPGLSLDYPTYALPQPNYGAAGNLYPVSTSGLFVNAGAGNYRIAATSPAKGIGAGGADPGANIDDVGVATAGVVITPATCNIFTGTGTVGTLAFPKPAYLVNAIEPNFGTTFTRVTGDVGGTVPTVGGTWPSLIYHNYAKDQPWSADGAYIAIKQTSGAFGSNALFLNGTTYAPAFTRAGPSGGGEWRWHPVTADVAISITDAGVCRHWNVVTNVTTTKVAAVSGYSSNAMGPLEGNPSYDGSKIVAKAIRDSDSHIVARVLNIDAGTAGVVIDLTAVGFASVADLDWVTISAGGAYVVAYGTISGGDNRTRVWDSATGSLVQTWNDYTFGHYDVGIDVDGNEVAFGVVGQAPYAHHFIMRRLDTGTITDLSGAWSSFNWHASTRNVTRPGWGYASINDATGVLLDREVVAVKLSSTNQIERLGRHRTNNIDYDSAAFACPSPDGKRVMFASNWGDASGRPVQTYVIDVRGICP